eukprot:5897849-Amphidinium_carterae.1
MVWANDKWGIRHCIFLKLFDRLALQFLARVTLQVLCEESNTLRYGGWHAGWQNSVGAKFAEWTLQSGNGLHALHASASQLAG